MLNTILKDTLSTMLSLMLVGLYGVIDGLYVGNAVGDIGLSAINIAWPIAAFITAIGIGIGIGGSVLIAHARGQNHSSHQQFQSTISLLLLAGLTMILILLPTYQNILIYFGATGAVYELACDYLQIVIIGALVQIIGTGLIPIIRNYGLSIHAMRCMITGTIMNVIINYFLIIIFDLGVVGAALGTIIAQLLVTFLAILTLKKHTDIKIKFYVQKEIIIKILKVGISAFGLSLAPSITLLFTNLQCLQYGGDAAVACYAVVAYISFPAQTFLTGVGEGTQPMMSFYAGSNQINELKYVKKVAYSLLIIVGLLLTFGVLFASPYIAGAFGLSKGGQLYFNNAILIYCFSFIIVGFSKFNITYLNATLETKKATILTFLESIIVSPLLLFILPAIHFEIEGIWLSYPVTGIIMIILYMITHRKTVSL